MIKSINQILIYVLLWFTCYDLNVYIYIFIEFWCNLLIHSENVLYIFYKIIYMIIFFSILSDLVKAQWIFFLHSIKKSN